MRRSALRRTVRRVGAAALGAAVLAAAAAPQVLPPEWFFDTPSRLLREAEAAFHGELLARNGMEALWTFDGPGLRGWYPDASEPIPAGGADPMHPSFPGTVLVPGRHGGARRFSGREESFFRTERVWEMSPQGFSVALWIRPKPLPRRQDVLATGDAGVWGLRLDGDRLCFDVTTSNGLRTVSCPFDRSRAGWTHVAFVSDPGARALRLYADGRLCAEEPGGGLSPAKWSLAFGAASWRKVRDPLRADLDDAAVWNRPLPADEIRRIAESPASLAELLGDRGGLLRLRFARIRAAVLPRLGRLRLRDLPRPLPRSDEPALCSLRISDSAWRHLSRGHARARASGCLTEGAATLRDAFLSIGGETVRCRLSLFGAPSFYPDSERPSYSVLPAEPGGTLPGGALRLVLSPPESCGWLGPLAAAFVAEETGLPVAPGCVPVRLRANGLDRGVYLLRDFSRCGGVAASERPPDWLEREGRHARFVTKAERDWVAPFQPSRTVAGAVRTWLSPEGRARVERRLAAAAGLVAADFRSPVPRPVRKRYARASVDLFRLLAPGPAPAAEAMVDATLFAGANVSPFRVVSDLPLAEAATKVPAGASLSFRSLAPEWIDDGGRVLRRPADAPVLVPFEASYRDPAGAVRVFPMEFRLMPESLGVPALSVWSGLVADKLRREDAVAFLHAAGPVRNEPDRVLSATAGTRGGLRFRGNSSFLDGRKRPLGLKTDLPHGVFPGSPTRALPMIDVRTDRLLLANALAFGLYRDFPRAGGPTNAAPRVVRAEVFLNGRYFGLQEFAERVDEDLLGAPEGDFVFYRYESVRPRDPDIKPVRPAPRDGDFAAPLAAAKALFAEPASPEWAEKVARTVDLDGFADFSILSNLFGNLNGGEKHWVFDEVAVFDRAHERFFYVPWDFDLTLRDAAKWIETDSDRRLLRDLPGYRERLAARWRELRAGVLAPDSLRARALALVDEIAPVLPFERRKWDGVPLEDAAADLERLRAEKIGCLEARAAMLDRRFGVRPEEGAP